jgi:hypothetical protein
MSIELCVVLPTAEISNYSVCLLMENIVISDFVSFALVAFFALLRFSDFVTLRLQHFSYILDHMIITVPYSKCDQ